MAQFNAGILGASGYTGAELVRLLVTHPGMNIAALTADRKAGMAMGDVFPQFAHLNLPPLQAMQDVDLGALDLVFCCLPHGITQEVVSTLPKSVKVVDLSADFRLRDPDEYTKWYGNTHAALEQQDEAVYGLTEFYRTDIAQARLVAGTGCNAATGQYILRPLISAKVIGLSNGSNGQTEMSCGSCWRKASSRAMPNKDCDPTEPVVNSFQHDCARGTSWSTYRLSVMP